jgi:O-antigen ligase
LSRSVLWSVCGVILFGILQAIPAGIGGGPMGAFSVAPLRSIGMVASIGAYALVFALVRWETMNPRRNTWSLIQPPLIVVGIEALLGIVQRVAMESGEFAVGTYMHHSHFAGLLAIGLPLAAMQAVLLVRASLAESTFGIGAALKSCATVAIPALVLTGIALASSRSAFISTLVALAIMGSLRIVTARARSSRLAGFVVLAGLLGAVSVLVVTDQMAARFENLSTPEKIAAEAPIRDWRKALELFSAYPVMGCGLGTYRVATGLITPGGQSLNAHSDYLQALAEFGVTGSLLVACLAFFLLKTAIRGAVAWADEGSRSLSIGCVAALAAGLLVSTVETNLYIPANAMLLSWIAGIAAGVTNGHREHFPLEGVRSIHSVYA